MIFYPRNVFMLIIYKIGDIFVGMLFFQLVITLSIRMVNVKLCSFWTQLILACTCTKMGIHNTYYFIKILIINVNKIFQK